MTTDARRISFHVVLARCQAETKCKVRIACFSAIKFYNFDNVCNWKYSKVINYVQMTTLTLLIHLWRKKKNWDLWLNYLGKFSGSIFVIKISKKKVAILCTFWSILYIYIYKTFYVIYVVGKIITLYVLIMMKIYLTMCWLKLCKTNIYVLKLCELGIFNALWCNFVLKIFTSIAKFYVQLGENERNI